MVSNKPKKLYNTISHQSPDKTTVQNIVSLTGIITCRTRFKHSSSANWKSHPTLYKHQHFWTGR